ncbi:MULTISPECIES: amino acid ABC transporter permease [Halomicrobium]|uniref:Polar amino acid ABC transporter, inner membrane subunit n=2 Tax=Halomicrobium mukohataei TaxID=57705 RepID=C7P3Y1_HALMD|nr:MULTISPECIES: amino acid ABC transporter permease [Halomicrobium]ACV47803.1 polar amino acid ABC transporter, inner membrane subunit [Halomicrobium mukohataei DSM 12286]QCD66251.1 amino acid ABC transporter permease [Halomicrobium mukohataei]QFR21057.1 ABC transporter permease subunit [Halomicrobium sp. ZPS1]
MSTDQTQPAAVGDLPGRRRVAVVTVGVVFWTWLSLRWAYHNTVLDAVATALGVPDLIRSETAVLAREPWLPTAPFANAAETLTAVGADLGPLGLLAEWLAWPFELTAFAIEGGPAMAAGAFITVYLTLASMVLGLAIAVPLSVARVYGGRIVGTVSLAYTELVRGTPLLAQLFLLYYGLPLAEEIEGLGLVGEGAVPRAAVFVAIVGFTINSSAYQAEYIRGALQSVDSGQLVAARSIGLSKAAGIRHVVLPQGLRYAIPGWTNEFVYLIKYSSLAAFITVPELFRQARIIASDSFRVTDTYVVVAVLYLALVLTTALAMDRLEAAVAVPGLGPADER